MWVDRENISMIYHTCNKLWQLSSTHAQDMLHGKRYKDQQFSFKRLAIEYTQPFSMWQPERKRDSTNGTRNLILEDRFCDWYLELASVA